MWEKIKKFFKWIADYTRISWIARKISSGWKWLFGGKANATQQNTSQQEKSSGNERQETHSQSKDNTLPKTPSGETILGTPNQSTLPEQHASSNKPNVAQRNTKPGGYLEFTDNKLLFITTNKNYKVLEAKCKNEDQEGKVIPGEFRVFVRYNDEDFCITGSYDSQQDVSGGKKSVSITSIRKQKAQSLVLSDPVEMMYTVGLDENRKLVEITRISRKPFKTATLEQPKPNTTGNNVTQQVVNNDSNETEVKQASGSTTTGLTEQLPEVNSTQELSTPNNEPVKIDTPDQPKSPAVPNEPQETLVNAHEEKGKPNNAASNGEVQPGVSNMEVDEEVKNLMVDLVDEVLAQDSGKTEEIPNSEKSKRESSTINVFNGNLELRLADDIQQKLEDYKHPKNNGKYRMRIYCNKNDFNINFSKKDKDGSVSLLINTLQKTDDKQVLSDTSKIKKSLGLEKRLTSVAIDFICKYQSVESPKLKVPTNNGVPSSETTSPEAEQHTVDTDLSVNA